MRRATIAGRPEIVQDLSVWFGDFKTTFGPFCSSTCAGRFGLAAWEQGVRLAQPVSNLPKPVKAGQKLIEGLTQIAEAVKGPETNSRRPKRQLLAAPNKEEGKTIKRPDIPAYTRAGIPKSVWDTMSVQQRGVIYWRLRMAEKGKGQGKPLNGSDFLNPGD
jgi:hypothetical protein